LIYFHSYKNYILYFTKWLNSGASLQLVEPNWLNLSHDKDYILGLAYRLCHIAQSKTLTQMENLCLQQPAPHLVWLTVASQCLQIARTVVNFPFRSHSRFASQLTGIHHSQCMQLRVFL